MADWTATPRLADAKVAFDANSRIVLSTPACTEALVVVMVASTRTEAALTLREMVDSVTPIVVAKLCRKAGALKLSTLPAMTNVCSMVRTARVPARGDGAGVRGGNIDGPCGVGGVTAGGAGPQFQ